MLAVIDPADPHALALAQLRPERWGAALRTIEASRMHAAANGGKLPTPQIPPKSDLSDRVTIRS